jgi:hypothetical protein
MSTSNIKLNFVNLSNDLNNSKIVIFQKNEAPGYAEIAVAWQVIQNCGTGDNHPFNYPLNMFVSASDSYGNFTSQKLAYPGDSFSMLLNPSGDQLVKTGASNYVTEVDIKNQLPAGSINANIYKSGKLLATKTNVVPGQMAAFVFKPLIYVAVVSEVEEGETLDSALVSQVNTSFSLLGIASADIVMSGGGSGIDSKPYSFTLHNVIMA